ncbi:hypothetical protein ACFQ4M_19535 [Thauera mechernichensis]|uniref:Uncharacterized protein n=1 Tax=Thauera mechernichensis TaxID=82788 RepID=A0ABW3WL20_9RHOO|nr:hypothetical protein [Thauera mechernichensis]MDG3066897.1 hypothetical protein [Thauera mechernichensis]
MDYHIYLDGEKCGELTDAENLRLRKEAKRDARTWGAFLFAQVTGTVRFLTFYIRLLGSVGGLAVLMVAMFAPQFQQAIQGQSGEEIAQAIRAAAIYLSASGAMIAAACLVFAPRMFGIPDVFEREFQRRVRLLKNIRRYGQLEVIGFTLPRTEGEQ